MADGIDPVQHRQTHKQKRKEAASNTFEAVGREWFSKQKSTWKPGHARTVISRMPKKLLVYDVNPYATIPYVIGCDPSGEKKENFSIPKRLARWIIAADDTVDVDELKKDIKDELTSTVMAALKLY